MAKVVMVNGDVIYTREEYELIVKTLNECDNTLVWIMLTIKDSFGVETDVNSVLNINNILRIEE